jgi:hypothetical protein
MPELKAPLVEVFQLGETLAGVLDLAPKFWPEPGQYLPAQGRQREMELLPINLFRVLGEVGRLSVGPIPKTWQPGEQIFLLSPNGHGFHLPASARRVGLCAVNVSPSRLLSLVPLALAQDSAVTLFCDPQPTQDILQRVPSVVEVAPISVLQENLAWPDFIAIDLPHKLLPLLDKILNKKNLPVEGQVLVRTSMPCHGLGECSVCTVETRHGNKLACVDGPVFPLKEVLHVAG